MRAYLNNPTNLHPTRQAPSLHTHWSIKRTLQTIRSALTAIYVLQKFSAANSLYNYSKMWTRRMPVGKKNGNFYYRKMHNGNGCKLAASVYKAQFTKL